MQAGCALVGGETAEMPGFYPEDEYDLAGFYCRRGGQGQDLGQLPRCRRATSIIALPSSGVHSNGFLSGAQDVRHVEQRRCLSSIMTSWASTLGEALLTPTRIYVKPVLAADGAKMHASSEFPTSPAAASMKTFPAALARRAAQRRIDKDERAHACPSSTLMQRRLAIFPSGICSTPSTWALACAVVVPERQAGQSRRAF